ncbi:hypothetical protein SK128_013955 [Halocaridina rubra]|uniref:Uncharacterized protein n=1 Tax=Halocaridina rubra TaxID=373956 RepID=A0AAN8WND5_HALRR
MGRCDGEPDCFDRTDEQNCPGESALDHDNILLKIVRSLNHTCSNDAFLCGNFKCIPEESRCDGIPDCDTDEIDCCEGSGLFECDGTCLTDDKKCDGIMDCGDGFDERGCRKCTQVR